MKKMNNKGFSLVELMVVVAIIGILSAIAIPNFQRFQRKSRQAEAKSTLGGIFAAEKAFHAEWNAFHGDLDIVGFIASGQLRYQAGFDADGYALTGIPGYTGPTETGRNLTSEVCAAFTNSCTQISSGALTPASTTPTAVFGNAAVFTAEAISDDPTINEDITAATDTWTIDQAGLVTNTVSGI